MRRPTTTDLGNTLLALALLALAPAAAGGSTLADRFQAELEALQAQYRFPGATAAYRLPDGTIGAAACGLADVESSLPMTPDSRMLAASIGKMFVGATAVALAQEGLLDLDGPIAAWLGDRAWFTRLPNHETITLRHLLRHQSGLANHVEDERFKIAWSEQRDRETAAMPPEGLIRFVLDQEPLFAAGESWHYSDTGYLLVGLIIEAATGCSYEETVSRRFLDPLALTLTTPSDRCELPGLATGYLGPDNPLGLPARTTLAPGVMAWHPGLEWTGGGLVSNPQDLVAWAGALFTGCALPEPYLEAILSSAAVGDEDSGTRYGLAVALHQDGPLGPTYGHSGWIPGYCSSLRYYPRSGLAIAFQINTDIGIVDGSTDLFTDMETRLALAVSTAWPGRTDSSITSGCDQGVH